RLEGAGAVALRLRDAAFGDGDFLTWAIRPSVARVNHCSTTDMSSDPAAATATLDGETGGGEGLSLRRRAGLAQCQMCSSIRPLVSSQRIRTDGAAITKAPAPSANTPPWPAAGRIMPMIVGPSSEPMRPTAEAKPVPVARTAVG